MCARFMKYTISCNRFQCVSSPSRIWHENSNTRRLRLAISAHFHTSWYLNEIYSPLCYLIRIIFSATLDLIFALLIGIICEIGKKLQPRGFGSVDCLQSSRELIPYEWGFKADESTKHDTCTRAAWHVRSADELTEARAGYGRTYRRELQANVFRQR